MAIESNTESNIELNNDITQTIQSIQNNQSNLEAEIKQLKQLCQEILEIKTTLQKSIPDTTATTTPTTTATPTATTISEKIVPVPVLNESAITLSDLLIKSIVSRVENILRFTAKFYTYILEMGPCIIIFLFIVRHILFED
jgi:hypothetical protein